MTKRVISSLLWFFAASYLGAFIATVVGVSAILGPILGLSMALIVGLDPLERIWTHGPRASVRLPTGGLEQPATQ